MAQPDTQTFENWMKAVHMMFEGQKGLKGLNLHVARLIQQNALESVRQGHGLNERGECGTCLTNQETRKEDRCIFNYVFGLLRYERNETLGWASTTIVLWRDDPWNVAKVFMPEYYNKWESKDGTDINGFLNFMKNCTLFEHYLEKDITRKVMPI